MRFMSTPTPRRTPAGAAVLREDVTEAIRAAVFEELAAVGFARMSIEGIARRAGVGKTAVYRRWKSKLALVLDVVGAVAAQGLPAPAMERPEPAAGVGAARLRSGLDGTGQQLGPVHAQ
ncbi:helix-turn-helix domain-containing protein, partial [Streptomyces hydrogenans]|uniref:helix-turn-helix domain-containing protein n=1 Tax=Streptomyces hydrogenans TaxID=1873719 RepID=UPI003820B7C5